jgi:hypothetical protein
MIHFQKTYKAEQTKQKIKDLNRSARLGAEL